jgi:hypothetical protein
MEAGVGIEPAYTDLQSAAWPLCHPAMILNQKREARRLPSLQNLERETSLELATSTIGKANGAPNHTATRLDVTKNCTEWLYDFMEFRTLTVRTRRTVRQ